MYSDLLKLVLAETSKATDMKLLAKIFLFVTLVLAYAKAECPHLDASLKKWDDAGTWTFGVSIFVIEGKSVFLRGQSYFNQLTFN